MWSDPYNLVNQKFLFSIKMFLSFMENTEAVVSLNSWRSWWIPTMTSFYRRQNVSKFPRTILKPLLKSFTCTLSMFHSCCFCRVEPLLPLSSNLIQLVPIQLAINVLKKSKIKELYTCICYYFTYEWVIDLLWIICTKATPLDHYILEFSLAVLCHEKV